MKKIINTLALVIGLASFTVGQSIDQSFYQRVDALLKANVSSGSVNYSSLKSNSELATLIEVIANADISDLESKSVQAFYINAYNLNVINQIINNLPLNSVMDVAGFFDQNQITVAKSQMTLNQLEKDRLLSKYNDPRFHFAVVCGAIGCPPITDFAYTPEKLEAQLQQQTQAAMNNPEFIKTSGGQVELSQIFNWYASDFGGNDQIISYINQYRSSPLDASTGLNYYEYDWSLNGK